MRIVLIILMAITSSGCISVDYKFGSYWVLEEDGSKSAWIFDDQCVSNNVNIDGSAESSNQIIAPYFIPLFYFSGASGKEIAVTIENQECPVLSVMDNGKNSLPYTKNSQDGERCKIHIQLKNQTKRILIEFLEPKKTCESSELTLIKKRFFCIRATEFGGSSSCKKRP